jgi:hypothetical protein
MSKPCCQTQDVCLPARSEIVKAGNLFHGKIFHSSGKESKFVNGALVELLSEARRRFVGTLVSILAAGKGCNVLLKGLFSAW